MTIWHYGYTYIISILLLSTTEVVISGKNKSNKSKNKQKPKIIDILILCDVGLTFYQYSVVNFFLVIHERHKEYARL